MPTYGGFAEDEALESGSELPVRTIPAREIERIIEHLTLINNNRRKLFEFFEFAACYLWTDRGCTKPLCYPVIKKEAKEADVRAGEIRVYRRPDGRIRILYCPDARGERWRDLLSRDGWRDLPVEDFAVIWERREELVKIMCAVYPPLRRALKEGTYRIASHFTEMLHYRSSRDF